METIRTAAVDVILNFLKHKIFYFKVSFKF